jgi:hypothetical protein
MRAMALAARMPPAAIAETEAIMIAAAGVLHRALDAGLLSYPNAILDPNSGSGDGASGVDDVAEWERRAVRAEAEVSRLRGVLRMVTALAGASDLDSGHERLTETLPHPSRN